MAEILAAAGLTLPTRTGILPWLTLLATAALVAIMLGALILHLRRSAYQQAAGDSVILAAVAAVGYMSI